MNGALITTTALELLSVWQFSERFRQSNSVMGGYTRMSIASLKDSDTYPVSRVVSLITS